MEFSLSEKKFLDSFESKLAENLSFRHGHSKDASQILQKTVHYLCLENSSKRVRPLIAFYFGNMLGISESSILDISLAAELIHSASLLHDDVIDAGVTRRGKACAHLQYSNTNAILSGNYLLALAFRVLEPFPKQIISEAITVVEEMTEAAILEIDIKGNLNCGIDTWKQMARGKTGALFAWCGKAMGILSGSSSNSSKLAKCGYHIGMAFQLADDAKDFSDDRNLKEQFADLKNREPSYPILMAAEASKEFRGECEAAWSQEIFDAAILGERLLAQGAHKACQQAMASSIAALQDSLGSYGENESAKRLMSWMNMLNLSAESGPMLGDVALANAATAV